MGKNSKTTSHTAETPSKPKRGLSFRNLFDQPIFHRTIGRGVPPRSSMRSEGDLRSNKHSGDATDAGGRTVGSESLSKVPRSTAASVLGVGSSSDRSQSGADLALECPLCLQVLPNDCFPHLLNCNHRSCRDCLRQYLKIEIMESRVNLTCPECDTPLHPTDIQIITDDGALLQKYEEFMLRRVLVADPDVRWCPAPDCGYAVIATGCASCPKIVCQRPNCGTKFCYHCKQLWHPNKTCDASRAERALLARSLSFNTVDATPANSGMAGEMKSCPRCGAFIVKMDDGSCNHMVCAICGAEFCWLCLKEISDLHYLSPSGCTFWGKKPWSRKKKILWQLGMLVGAPVVIALIAGVAVPAIIVGVPIWVGRKLYHKHRNKGKHKRNALIVAGVSGTILVSPLLAAAAVSLGVPVMLAYVYGVVPISLCRSEGCAGSDEGQGEGVNGEDEVPEAVIVTTSHPGAKEADIQADESSIGTAGPSLYNQPVEHGHVGDAGGDRESTSTRAVAGYSLCDDHSIAANRVEVHADVAQTCHGDSKISLPSPDLTAASSQAGPLTRDLTGAASGGVEDASCDQLAAIGGGRQYRPMVRKHSALVTPATVNGAQSVQFDESDLVFEANVERRRSWFTRHSLSVGDQLHKHVTSPRRPRGKDGSFGCVSEKSSVGGVLSYDDHLHQFGADARVAMTTSSIASPDDESNASLTLPFYGDCDRVAEIDVLGTDNPQFTSQPEPDEGSRVTQGTSRDGDVATSVREIHAEISSKKSR